MLQVFDILHLDGESKIHETLRTRRWLLQEVIVEMPGHVQVTSLQELDFSEANATEEPLRSLGVAFAKRWEGYVMKPMDAPYFDSSRRESGYRHCYWIKLKKDYIKGLGDVVDMAVLGASYDAEEAARLKAHFNIESVPWTHFYIGSLLGKYDAIDSNAVPELVVVDRLSYGLGGKVFQQLCMLAKACAVPRDSPEIREHIISQTSKVKLPKMTVIFPNPLVLELRGFGFHIPEGSDILAIRFPQALRIRGDISFREVVSFDKLQEQAKQTMEQEGDLIEEVAHWVRKMKRVGQNPPEENNLLDCDYEEYLDELESGLYRNEVLSQAFDNGPLNEITDFFRGAQSQKMQRWSQRFPLALSLRLLLKGSENARHPPC